MPTLNAINLIVNSLALALSLGFLFIILWHNTKKPKNQFFAVFLIFVLLWNTGSLLVQAVMVTQMEAPLLLLASGIMETGFAGGSIACYALATVLVGVQTQRFRVLAFLGIGFVVTYRLFLIVSNPELNTTTIDENLQNFQQQYHTITISFYTLFNLTTAYVMWHYRRRIEFTLFFWGIGIFIVGQSLTFLNPSLTFATLSTSIGSIGAFIISIAVFQSEIIRPLNERNSQVESIHQVSLAITSQTASDKILDEIGQTDSRVVAC
ncbi:hypothetical protein HC928_06185 [bacterium]|nr:hypothetical protein [bacterium]